MAATRDGSTGSAQPLRLAQLIAALSIATDIGTGQSIDHALRTCLLGQELARRSGVAMDRRAEVCYLALLRFVGCTADSFETAQQVGGDDIGFISGMSPGFLGSPREQLTALIRSAGNGLGPVRRVATTVRMLADTHGATRAVTSHCDAAQRLSARVRVGDGVTAALGRAFERWDGTGIPGACAREEVPASVRVVEVARDVDLWLGIGGIEAAVDVIRKRAGHAYDPAVAAAFTADAHGVLDAVGTHDAWQATLDAEPDPPLYVAPGELTGILHAFADFADLKSPWLRGHSPAVAALAAEAARLSGLTSAEVTTVRQAGLVHDLGWVGIRNGIWDKTGPLTLDEWEKVRLHPYLTERILSRSTALAPLARLAACHHERVDGSGYHRGARSGELSIAEQLLSAADAYQAMTAARPHRPPFSSDDAARELRREASGGRFGATVVDAVLEAAGHAADARPRRHPAGLTDREVEVLRLIARGRSNRQVAAELVISAKTVGAHIEHIYAKAGVSTRAGAALFAMEHELLGRPPER